MKLTFIMFMEQKNPTQVQIERYVVVGWIKV